ncbi:MAG TPA: hypothetical protein VIG46_06570 [Candidatus Baltobacteraceae bacterium]|jgi:hypothetical protein
MKRLLAALILATGSIAGTPLPAAATVVSVHNASGLCAHVSVSTAWDTKSWRVVPLDTGRPQFLKNGVWWPFFLPADPNVKVSAAILSGPECSGRTIASVSAFRTGLTRDGRYVAKVQKTAGGYELVIYR